MVQRVSTIAFEGIEASGVVAPGLPAFAIGVPLAGLSVLLRYAKYFFAHLAPDGELNYLLQGDYQHW